MNNQKNIHRRIELLDWCIILSVIIMFLMIYIPSSIWKEEVEIRNKARHRMTAISNAQEFYKELTGTYTMNGEHMFQLVEAATDSLIADSLFLGSQIIELNLENYLVNMNEGFEVRVDTTFSESQNIKLTYLDTTYTILRKSKFDEHLIDTSFINGIEALEKIISKPNFEPVFDINRKYTVTKEEQQAIWDECYLRLKPLTQGLDLEDKLFIISDCGSYDKLKEYTYYVPETINSIADTLEQIKTRLETDYLRLKYHLADSLLYCPITKEKYFFHIINKEITVDDDVDYMVKGAIISNDDNYIIFQTQSQDINLDDSQIQDNEENLDDSNLRLRNILISSISKNYKADLLKRMEESELLSTIDKYGIITLRLDKNKIIESADIEESIFSVETPLSKDYKESRFVIFSFESGDHGRIIDGSTSWSE